MRSWKPLAGGWGIWESASSFYISKHLAGVTRNVQIFLETKLSTPSLRVPAPIITKSFFCPIRATLCYYGDRLHIYVSLPQFIFQGSWYS